MGDFYLNLRTSTQVTVTPESELRWFPDTKITKFDTLQYTLVIARSEPSDIWAPAVYGSAPNRVIVGMAGRVALSARQWEAVKRPQISGGTACSALIEIYLKEGSAGLEKLSGNFCLIVVDEARNECHLVTDRTGLQLVYASDHAKFFCSHPDILAKATGQEGDLALESLAEFLISGRVSFPHTYYRSIKALPWGTTYSFDFINNTWVAKAPKKHFHIKSRFSSAVSLDDAADMLSAAFRSAISTRAYRALGHTAVAMSGGMDSRAVLSSIEERSDVEGFVLIDKDNAESHTARLIANACHTRFTVIHRDFDHYGASAVAGARISGGMGCLASNHFLGIRKWIMDAGIQNLLTGCYCDYLFKALALNTEESRYLRREKLTAIRPEYYRPLYLEATYHRPTYESRLAQSLPHFGKPHPSDDELFETEIERVFPLACEADSVQRVIGQRVLSWFAPMADNELLEVYQRIPAHMKLNGRLFKAMLRRVCPSAVLSIPDSNTGAPLLAHDYTRALYRYRSAILNRMNKMHVGIAGRGSWPNWQFYMHTSKLIRSQWEGCSKSSLAVLEAIMPQALLSRPLQSYQGREVELSQRIWTLKLWLDHRVGHS